MKKIITTVMTLLLISSIFIGCGNSTTKGLNLEGVEDFPKFEEMIKGKSFVSKDPYLNAFRDAMKDSCFYSCKGYQAYVDQTLITKNSHGIKGDLKYVDSYWDDLAFHYIYDNDYCYDIYDEDKFCFKKPANQYDHLNEEFEALNNLEYQNSYNVTVNGDELTKEICTDGNNNFNYYFTKAGVPVFLYYSVKERNAQFLFVFTDYSTDVDDSLFEIPDDYEIYVDYNQIAMDYVYSFTSPDLYNGGFAIGFAFDEFFNEPEWIGYEEDENFIIECHGECQYGENTVDAVVKIVVYKDGSYDIVSLELGDEDVTDELLVEFIDTVYSSYENKRK